MADKKPGASSTPIVVHFEDGRNVRFPAGMDEDAVSAICRQIAMPLPKPTPPTSTGAPTDFGGPVLPNPKGVQPQSDTENPPPPGNVPASTDNFVAGDAGMNTSNPAKSSILPPAVVQAAKTDLGEQ
jgi:hypothetical protein